MLTYTWLRCFHHAFGLRSVVLAPDDTKFISRSKFCSYLRVEGIDQEEVCVARLQEAGRRLVAEGRVPLLLGADDWYARIIAKHKDALSEWFVVPAADYALMDRLSGPEGLRDACEKAGVPYLRSWSFDCAAQAPATVPADVVYPVTLTPADPIAYRAAQLPHKQRAYTARNAAELRDALDELRLSAYDGTATARCLVPGGDEGLRSVSCFCGADGELRAWSTGRVLVEGRAALGAGPWDCILLEREDALAEQAGRLLKAVGWRGFATLDALFDARDGSYRFLAFEPHAGRSAFVMNVGGTDIARLLVGEYLLSAPAGEVQVACDPGIYTVVPRYVVRRSVQSKPLRRQALSLFDQGKAKNPLFYHADTLTHGFWARLLYVEQIRAFRRGGSAQAAGQA